MSGRIQDSIIYGFINWDIKKVIDLERANPDPGTQVISFHGHFESENNQIWTAKSVPQPGGGSSFNLVNVRTGTYLDTQKDNDGTIRVVCNPKDSQKISQTWTFTPVPGNDNPTPSFAIQNPDSGNQVITVKDGSSADITKLILAPRSDILQGLQRWIAVPVTPAK